MTIDHHYWKHDHECYYTRQVEKKAFESHFWKQGKASSTCNTMVSQNKASTSLVASSTKLFLSKLSLPALKKQSNFLWIDFVFWLKMIKKISVERVLCWIVSERDQVLMLWLKFLCKNKRWLLYWVIQKNSIEFQV